MILKMLMAFKDALIFSVSLEFVRKYQGEEWMTYNLNNTPYISKLYSFNSDEENNRVICSVEGQIKILNCNPSILLEVLSYVNGKTTFKEIEDFFVDRFPRNNVKLFLSELLKEGIIKQTEVKNKVMKILVIGEKIIGNTIKACDCITIDKFLNSVHNLEGYKAVLVLSSKLTYRDMIKVNNKLCKLGKTFNVITFNDEELVVGPLVIPGKTSCLNCKLSEDFSKLNSRLPNDKKINNDKFMSLKYSCELPNYVNKEQISYIIDSVKNDMNNFLNEGTSIFLGYQHRISLTSLDSTNQEILITTKCECCNNIYKNYTKFNPKTMEIKNLIDNMCVNKEELQFRSIEYSTGGIRSRDGEATKKFLEKELNKLGAKVKIEPAYGNPFNDSNIIHCYNAHIEQSNLRNIPYMIKDNNAAGKGITEQQSYFSAGFELLEHISLQYTGDIPIISARYSEIASHAVDFKYLDDTIMNKNTYYDNYEEDKEIDWVVATSLSTGEKKLVPAFLVFMYDVNLKGTLFGSSSNGAGSAVTLEDAILHGLFEAIERDGWLIGQSNPFVLPIVDYASVTNIKIKEIIRAIQDLGYDIMTRDYTNDLGVPVFRTWIVNRDDYSRYAYSGLGCHVSPEIALERSITEAVQVDDWSHYDGPIDSGMISHSVLMNSLINIYNQHFLVNKDILGKTNKKTKIEAPIFEMNSSYEGIQKLTELLKEKTGGDVYYIDLTKPGMDVKVVRTIITGDFQQMNIPLLSVSKRMFEFGINCGYSDQKTSYEELFMGHYQH